MDGVFRCRKCGKCLFDPQNLIEEQRLTDMRVEHSEYTQWFLNPDTCPDWIKQAVLKERYTRGKLGCPKCLGRVGSFDFIRKQEYRELGPVWVQKSRIDLVRPLRVRMPPTRTLPPTRTSTQVLDPGVRNHSDSEGHQSGVLPIDKLDREPTTSKSREVKVDGEQSPPVQEAGVRAQHVDDGTPDPRHGADIQAPQDDGGADMGTISGGRFQVLAEENDHPRDEPCHDIVEDVADPEDVYTCPICLDLLYHAHTCHPCLHVYCAPCLRRLCGATPIHTKCPLCRQVISSCLPNHEMTNLVKTIFPDDYKLRNSSEKKTRKKLPPLPSNHSSAPRRFNRDRNRNYVLVHWAGVCFVVLLCVMAISILATTVGMLLWYLWETFMDYFIDGLVSVNGYFDYSWQLFIMILMEKSDDISPELAKILLGSFGQVLHAVGKLFNRTIENAKDLSQLSGLGKKKENAQYAYTVSAFQVDLANYVLVMGFVTYLIYRFARYRQARQVEAALN